MRAGVLHHGHMFQGEAGATLEPGKIITTGSPALPQPSALILGPHPGNGTFSISNYFTFWKYNLAPGITRLSHRHGVPRR